MDDKLSGYGLIIFLILMFVFFGNGWNGWGGRAAFAADIPATEVERRNIIEAAETNYRVIEQGNLTRQVVEATANATQQKIDFYAYQDLRDQLAEAQRKNLVLENQLYNDRKFGAIEMQLANISCRMAKEPQVYACSTSCNPIYTPQFCGCGCNGVA